LKFSSQTQNVTLTPTPTNTLTPSNTQTTTPSYTPSQTITPSQTTTVTPTLSVTPTKTPLFKRCILLLNETATYKNATLLYPGNPNLAMTVSVEPFGFWPACAILLSYDSGIEPYIGGICNSLGDCPELTAF
jgi:hypothetical protein